MTRSQLITKVANDTNMTAAEVEKVMDGIFGTIGDVLKSGEPVLLLRPEQEWEGRSAAATGRRWNEGSYLLKHNRKYYMTYSGNFFAGPDYAVGYATADTPLGPYTKAPENPTLERAAQVTGTGHNCMFRTTAGKLMICYHGRTEATGNDRIAFISPAHFDEQGRLVIDAE